MPTSDAFTKVSFVSSISNTSAPTVAELGAGVSLEGYITPDGFDLAPEDASYDTSVLNTDYETEDIGREKYTPKLTMRSDLKADTAWTTFATRGTAGYLVARRGVSVATGWTAGQKVEVIPVKSRKRRPAATASNEDTKVMVDFVLTGDPVDAATVAS